MLNNKKGNFFNLTDGGVLGGTKKAVGPSTSSSSAALDAAAQSRKLSSTSTASYFSKLSFSGSGRSNPGSVAAAATAAANTSASLSKEKKIFGSPRLHRAIFGKVQNNNSNNQNSPGNRSPIFDEVILGQGTPSWMDTRREVKRNQETMPDIVGSTTQNSNGGASPGTNKSVKTPEYPEMECPPVFRPETYSLSDPSTSNTLTRRRNNLNKKSA